MENDKKLQRHRDSEHVLSVASEKRAVISVASVRRAIRVTNAREEAALRRILGLDPKQER